MRTLSHLNNTNQLGNQANAEMQHTHHSNHPPGLRAVNYLTSRTRALHTEAISGPSQFINWSAEFPRGHKGSIGRLLWAFRGEFPNISHNLCAEGNICWSLVVEWRSMCGPNEKEIGLCTWKQFGTPCTPERSRHCISIALRTKYLFSVRRQIEPRVIIVYP